MQSLNFGGHILRQFIEICRLEIKTLAVCCRIVAKSGTNQVAARAEEKTAENRAAQKHAAISRSHANGSGNFILIWRVSFVQP